MKFVVLLDSNKLQAIAKKKNRKRSNLTFEVINMKILWITLRNVSNVEV